MDNANQLPEIDYLKSLLAGSDNPLLFLTIYGSRKQGSDIDLLAVYAGVLPHFDYSIGRLDLLALGIRQFERLLKNHDLIVTEPLLTGDLLFGDPVEWEERKQSFLETRPNDASLYHLAMRMMQVMNSAESFLERFQATSQKTDAFFFLKNLSFALGYLGFLQEYARGRFPIVLKDVLDAIPLLRETNERKSTCGQGIHKHSHDQLKEMLSQGQTLCLSATTKKGAQPCD